MKDEQKTKKQLIKKLVELHRRNAKLEKTEAERKGGEEELRESEERFRVALKGSPIVVWNQDKELRYTWIHNPHPGFEAEETIGKTDEQLLPPDDAARLPRSSEGCWNAVSRREKK